MYCRADDIWPVLKYGAGGFAERHFHHFLSARD
jgi:hypothetical protein